MKHHKAIVILTTFIGWCFISTTISQSLAPDHFERELSDRMAACHYTLARTYEQAPISRLLTYHREFSGFHFSILAKIVPQVEINGKVYSATDARDIRVEDVPGGVIARFTLGSVAVETSFTPLMVGLDEPTRTGAALYRIKTTPGAIVRLQIGELQWQKSSFEDTRKTAVAPLDARDNRVEKSENTYMLRTSEHSVITGVRTVGAVSIKNDGKEGQFLECTFAKGDGQVLLGFSENKNQLLNIAGLNTTIAVAEINTRYNDLLTNRIETPDTLMNQAFRSALITLEYSWFKPYGWMESIHHWVMVWHMQHTAAAEWLGQTDRSYSTITTQAKRVLSDGAIPFSDSYGIVHRNFGGTNQFWAWQVRHYWNFTADKEFGKIIAPVLDKVISQSFSESDKDKNLLLGWGLQIGNQEDYIATMGDGTSPSIEGANMMRTRAELAAGLGDTETASMWNAQTDLAIRQIRSQLWKTDLGRHVYFNDQVGNPRLDGQYHTFAYPAIFGISDFPDAYSSLRHMADRLTGSNGEVYCSNNFAFHAVGTWGMQAGVAQQPWAAWAYGAMGMRNNAVKPLHAAASWVMDENHRGSWPEVSTEGAPMYFSPPAGLYVASVTEAIFGLQMHRPEGYITIAPCFPDSWPKASIHLKNHQAEFKRDGNTLRYMLHTTDKLARRVKWPVPLCKNVKLFNHGKSVPVKLLPGINGFFVSAELPAENKTDLTLSFDLVSVEITAPGSLAEGDPLQIKVESTDVKIKGIDDRNQLLRSARVGDSQMEGTLRDGLLEPYLGFGTLGELNFSRRTLFLAGATNENAEFYIPVDFTVLQRFEAWPVGELKADNDKISVEVLLRNNTMSDISGEAKLKIGSKIFPVQVNVKSRGERKQIISFKSNDLYLFTPGVNTADFILPGGETVSLKIIMGEMLQTEALQQYAKINLQPINIDALLNTPDLDWLLVRKYEGYFHWPWSFAKPPLEALETSKTLDIPQIPGLSFRTPGRSFAVLSRSNGTPVIHIPTDHLQCRKLYFLLVPLLDNADMFSKVARISVRDKEGTIITRTLSYPGDLDASFSPKAVDRFATGQENRPLLNPVLSQIPPGENDRKEGKAPAFPQPAYWSNSASVVTPSGIFSVIEFDLNGYRDVDWIEFEALDAISALGLVGVTAHVAGHFEMLKGTAWNPPAVRFSPETLFELNQPSDLNGWQFEGEAFSLAPVKGLFNEVTLNSIAKNGSPAIGKAISPAFRIPEWCNTLELDIQAGMTTKDDKGEESPCIRLVDADTGKECAVLLPPCTHTLNKKYMNVTELRGRNLRLVLDDQSDKPSLIWIGVSWIGIKQVRCWP